MFSKFISAGVLAAVLVLTGAFGTNQALAAPNTCEASALAYAPVYPVRILNIAVPSDLATQVASIRGQATGFSSGTRTPIFLFVDVYVAPAGMDVTAANKDSFITDFGPNYDGTFSVTRSFPNGRTDLYTIGVNPDGSLSVTVQTSFSGSSVSYNFNPATHCVV